MAISPETLLRGLPIRDLNEIISELDTELRGGTFDHYLGRIEVELLVSRSLQPVELNAIKAAYEKVGWARATVCNVICEPSLHRCEVRKIKLSLERKPTCPISHTDSP